MKPGETIAPGSEAKPPEDKSSKPKSAAPKKTDDAELMAIDEKDASWEYSSDEGGAETDESAAYVQPISWTAAEYVDHQKNFGWFFLVLLAIFAVTAGVYVVTRELISTIVILIIGTSFTAFAGRPPRTLEYSVDATGVHIGHRTYPYNRFRSFAILGDEPVPTIMLIPLRRFDLPINLHFDAGDADKIIEMLGNFLPGEERGAPPVDRLMSKIHF